MPNKNIRRTLTFLGNDKLCQERLEYDLAHAQCAAKKNLIKNGELIFGTLYQDVRCTFMMAKRG